ncbi:methyltransferase, partial [Arcobacter sp. HD9-500m-PIT-SAG03]
FKYIGWEIDFYKAVDFSSSMCAIHPKAKNVKVECHDFDDDSFHDSIKDEKYDLVISSSALQWSKDLKKIVKRLISITNEINVALFTSNTFKTIQDITNSPSPILSQVDIKEAFFEYCDCDIEVFNYNLEFENKKELFNYIKKSGVSGNNKKLSYKDSKLLLQKYNLNYLEFEVIFIKAFSKS